MLTPVTAAQAAMMRRAALGAVRGLRDRRLSSTAVSFALPGLLLLGISVPLQFTADAHLSSAVW